MPKHTLILGASSNLLGIALVLIAALNVTIWSERTLADEIAWVSALCFSLSCLLSYFALRSAQAEARFDPWADRIFMVGLAALLISVGFLGLAPR